MSSVIQVWGMATDPTFLVYATLVFSAAAVLSFMFTGTKYSHFHLLIYIAICSLMGSMSVMRCARTHPGQFLVRLVAVFELLKT